VQPVPVHCWCRALQRILSSWEASQRVFDEQLHLFLQLQARKTQHAMHEGLAYLQKQL
jgi:hypothetical protein